ncbi:hypothetical protein G5I_08024 [Acromyrmex echinatior]|uniref:Uncharacterized protein n=1 Tax=Acromyrmex echinatior TaxID=103372 RepID=F4WQD6_ACREC|nr:hypothetical protein G5I_08024 [Acromyrmex echinatior]
MLALLPVAPGCRTVALIACCKRPGIRITGRTASAGGGGGRQTTLGGHSSRATSLLRCGRLPPLPYMKLLIKNGMFVLSGSQNQKIQKISRILEDESGCDNVAKNVDVLPERGSICKVDKKDDKKIVNLFSRFPGLTLRQRRAKLKQKGLDISEQLIFHANIHSDNCSSQDQLSEFNKENEALPCFNPSNRSTIRMNHSQEYNKKRKEYRKLTYYILGNRFNDTLSPTTDASTTGTFIFRVLDSTRNSSSIPYVAIPPQQVMGPGKDSR